MTKDWAGQSQIYCSPILTTPFVLRQELLRALYKYAPIQNHKSLANYFLAGDEIFSVNGRSVAGLTHSEAIGIFKETKVGPIQVTIGRRETNKKVLQMDDDRA